MKYDPKLKGKEYIHPAFRKHGKTDMQTIIRQVRTRETPEVMCVGGVPCAACVRARVCVRVNCLCSYVLCHKPDLVSPAPPHSSLVRGRPLAG